MPMRSAVREATAECLTCKEFKSTVHTQNQVPYLRAEARKHGRYNNHEVWLDIVRVELLTKKEPLV